jgi:hypothetical protein
MSYAVKIDPAIAVSNDEDAAHRALERWIDRYGSSATGAAYGRMNLHNVHANGQQVAGLDEAGKLDVLSRLTAFSNSDSGRTQVTVQAGDTLRTIAQRIYGNGNLWYVIAEANALTEEDALAAGVTLTAPEVKTSSNDASTFKPYNPGEIAGPTSPGLPYIEPPDKGCGTLGMIIMVAIAVVVTAFTYGQAAPYFSTMFGAAAGTVSVAGAVAGGFVAGAAGSIASQAAGSAMGVASFSWRQVAADGITNAFTMGVSQGISGVGALTTTVDDVTKLNTLGRVVQGVSSYGGSVVGNAVVGRDTNFSWNAVAASAVSAAISANVGGKVPLLKGGTTAGDIFNDLGGYLIDGAVSSTTRRTFGFGKQDWRQVAIDAFGNALGSAAVRAISKPTAAESLAASINRTEADIQAKLDAKFSAIAQTDLDHISDTQLKKHTDDAHNNFQIRFDSDHSIWEVEDIERKLHIELGVEEAIESGWLLAQARGAPIRIPAPGISVSENRGWDAALNMAADPLGLLEPYYGTKAAVAQASDAMLKQRVDEFRLGMIEAGVKDVPKTYERAYFAGGQQGNDYAGTLDKLANKYFDHLQDVRLREMWGDNYKDIRLGKSQMNVHEFERWVLDSQQRAVDRAYTQGLNAIKRGDIKIIDGTYATSLGNFIDKLARDDLRRLARAEGISEQGPSRIWAINRRISISSIPASGIPDNRIGYNLFADTTLARKSADTPQIQKWNTIRPGYNVIIRPTQVGGSYVIPRHQIPLYTPLAIPKGR